VEFGTSTAYGSSTTLNAAKVVSHAAGLTGLAASTVYHFRVKSRDAAGNLAVSGDFTFTTAAPPDTTAPTISGVISSNLEADGATVTWTTDEASDTQVDFGTSTAYGGSSPLDNADVTSHSVYLSGLAAGTTYHFRVKSRDAAGNLGVSGDYTFTNDSDQEQTVVLRFQYPSAKAIYDDFRIAVAGKALPLANSADGAQVRLQVPAHGIVKLAESACGEDDLG